MGGLVDVMLFSLLNIFATQLCYNIGTNYDVELKTIGMHYTFINIVRNETRRHVDSLSLSILFALLFIMPVI